LQFVVGLLYFSKFCMIKKPCKLKFCAQKIAIEILKFSHINSVHCVSVFTSMESLLGSRTLDKEFSFIGNQNSYGYPLHYLKNFISLQKLSHSSETTSCKPILRQIFFSKEQLELLEKIRSFCSQPKQARSVNPFKYICVSRAGMGKSLLLNAISNHLKLCGIPVLIVAFTGNSAAGVIGGRTLHGAFGLHYKSNNFEYLAANTLDNTRTHTYELLKSCEVLILEECYYFSPVHLAFIDAKLRQIKGNNKEFGNCSVLMTGDPLQSFPIFHGPLFQNRDKVGSEFTRRGIDLYRKVDKVFQLTKNFRQAGDKRFQHLLHNIRYKQVTQDDVDLLNTRLFNNLSDEEKDYFKDALKVYPFRNQVHEANLQTIRDLQIPVTVVHSYQEPSFPRFEPTSLLVGVGTRIILTRNIDIKAGLYRGKLGTVKSWVYQSGRIEIIFVQFDDYQGLKIHDLVPIARYKETINTPTDQRNVNQYQFPLELAFAKTSHSTQGLTISKIAVYLGATEYFVSQTYVSLSRTTSLSNLCILDESLSLERFTSKNFMKGSEMQFSELARLGIDEQLQL